LKLEPWNGGLAFVSLTYKPENLKETAEFYHKIIQDLVYLKTEAKLVNELEHCNLLCCTVDEYLIIEKVELEENIMLSIFSLIANEEGLKLTIERKN
jgi:hypothetical protein